MSRVKQVCALDDDFRLIQKDAVVLLTKATEMFVQDLAATSNEYARKNSRKTMQVNDILSVAMHADKFHFLSDSKLPALTGKKK